MVSAVPRTLLRALADAVGPGHVLTDPDAAAPYTVDWTRRFGGPAAAVVRPAATAEVVAVVTACAAAGFPIVVQGGNTGLVGGGVPPAAAAGPAPVVLATTRLTEIGEVDPLSGQVAVGAGVTLATLHQHARDAGWSYGVDLAARDTATVGGTVATNAGGVRVCAYGMTRAQVTGLAAVLADGSTVTHLAGLAKDNTGYDLTGLLVGSEGTLGIVTTVRLRLHRPAGPSTVALIGASSYDEAQQLLAGCVRPGVRLLAAEIVDEVGLELVLRTAGLPRPLAARHRLLLLVEVADGATADGLELPDDVDAVVATDAADRLRLWAYRERQSEAFSTLGVVHKLDVSIPLASVPDCTAAIAERVQATTAVTTYGVFGHLADGNLHLEVVGPAPDDDEIDRAVFGIVTAYGGSISAEHGIGRAKAAYLSMTRTPQEISAMRAIKTALDPAGLFNPGVLLA